MENVTHALAGLLVADVIVQARSSRGASGKDFPKLALITSAVANNLPDADLLYASGHGKLGYLMHHRGHTHTLPIGTALGLALAAAVVLFAKHRAFDITRCDKYWLLFLGTFGAWTHMAMDALNIYGVHPFWPLDNAWHYGDSVFIVEPLFWFVAIPALIHSAQHRLWKRGLVAVLALGTALVVFAPKVFVLPSRALALVVLASALFAFRTMSHRMRAYVSASSFVAVALMFLSASTFARSHVLAAQAAQAPTEVVHDVALSPLPANPFCWSGVVTTTAEQDLVLQRVAFSFLPSLVSADSCLQTLATPRIARGEHSERNGVHFYRSFQRPILEWQRLVQSRCDVETFSRFARVPFWVERNDETVVGDLRFDSGGGNDFSELRLPDAPEYCSALWAAPWVPPRRALMSAQR